LVEPIYGYVRTAGAALSPFNAWICLKGLETLRLRIEAQSDRALELATWLGSRPAVKRVHYAGLPSHPQHQLALTQATKQGAVLAFEVEGGQDAAWRVIDACKLISITANLGDTKSTITHPATTTHARLSPAERGAAGITDGLVRVAVGLESFSDLSSDLDRLLFLR
jgi:O-succinylhomoserine sulfhydrylase